MNHRPTGQGTQRKERERERKREKDVGKKSVLETTATQRLKKNIIHFLDFS